MQNRLLAIIYLLMRRQTVTAAELADRFEVSRRTIYRDVETLSMAGIPVYARKGKGGGICLTEQFVLNKMLISETEQTEILAALTSLRETGAQPHGETLQKLADFFQQSPREWVAIDLSDWSGQRQWLFALLKQAILTNQVIRFDYYGQSGAVGSREAEPVQLIFKEYTWYLRAFCRTRQAIRLFKLMRMKRVCLTGRTFVPDGARYEERREETDHRQREMERTRIRLVAAASEAYRVYDRFEEDEITRLDDGSFRIDMECILDDWVYGMILSFGPSVRVIGPLQVKEEIRTRLEKMLANY